MTKFLCLLIFAAAAQGQTVEGAVVNTVTGAGIAGVNVTLAWAGDTWYSATTDAQGRFLFDHVQNGPYNVFYSSSDYSWDRTPGTNRPLQVTAGANPIKLEARMTALGWVSGRVIDGNGHAVPGASVQLTGPRSAMAMPADANGKFALHERVVPDSYTLSVAAPASLKPPDPEPDGSLRNWTRTYFPGVSAPEAATKIVIHPGSQVSDLELKLRALPAHAVRGVVFNPDSTPVSKAPVTLRGDAAFLTAESGPDGAFEFPAVVDAEWELSAEIDRGGVKLKASQWFEMAEHDREGVKLRLSPPFTVRGKIIVETPQGAPAPRLPSVSLALHDPRSIREAFPEYGMLSMVSPGSPDARPDASGNLSFEKVYPGYYRIVPMNAPPGYYLDSLRVGEAEPSVLEVEFSSGTAPVTLLYKTKGGSVRGAAEGCASGGVVLIPQEPALRRTGFLHSAQCDANDRYEIVTVRPGDYYVLAFAGDGPEPYSRSRLDDAVLSRAVKVSVRAGEAAAADLRAIGQEGH